MFQFQRKFSVNELLLSSMPSIFLSFLVCYLTYLVTIKVSQAHPLRGTNVRDVTSSDNLTFVVSIGIINRNAAKYFCTGNLITRWSVLTCQHCIADKNKNNVRITIGSTDLRLSQKYGVADWKSYDQWHFNTSELESSTGDDIAIITLDRKVDDPNVKPASILYTGILGYLNNYQLRIAGWGLVDNGTRPAILKTGLVKPISSQECTERGRNVSGDLDVYVPRHYFCSLANPWLLANCGDSGGPTLNEDNQIIALITGACPVHLYTNFSPEFRDENLMNNHLSLLIYKSFIDAVAVP